MNSLVKKVCVISLVNLLSFFGNLECAFTQTPTLHDSLKNMLSYFLDKTKDEKIKQAIKEAAIIETGNFVSDSYTNKFLIADSLIVNAYLPDRQMVLTYAQAMVRFT